MSSFKTAIRTLRQRERARCSLYEFAEQTVLRKIARRVAAPHHKVVCGALQRHIEDPTAGILVLLLPPGAGKTIFTSHILPSWVLGRSPGERVLLITNSLPLAENSGRAVRGILGTKTYEHIFDSTVAVGSSAAGSFSTTNGGTVFAAGAGGAVLGRRASLVICDDLVSGWEEANSPTQMEKLWESFNANILTRLVPGGKLVLIMQRLAHADPAGKLLERRALGTGGRRIDVVRLPMLCDDPDNDLMGRAEGEPLWPEYFSRGMLLDAMADDLKWKTMYQLKPPATTGDWCAATDLEDTPTPRRVIGNPEWNVMIGCDIAHTVAGGDATVFAVMAMNRRTAALHFTEVYREHVDGATSCEELLNLIAVWCPTWIGIDNDGGSRGWVSHLRTRAFARGIQLPIEELPMAGKSKELRAGALRAKIKGGLVHLDRGQPWSGAVLREFTGFPFLTGAAVDDIVDACSLVARKTSLMAARVLPTAPVDRKMLHMTDMCLDDLHDDALARMAGRSQRIG